MSNICAISPSYRVGDHFVGTGGEFVITELRSKTVFYHEVGDPSMEGSMMSRLAFDSALCSGIIHSQRTETDLEKAKRLIDSYCVKEFIAHGDFEDLSRIPIGHTTVTDDELPIQIYADLANFKIDRYILDVLVETRQYTSLADLTNWELDGMDFDDLTWFTDEQIDFAIWKVKN